MRSQLTAQFMPFFRLIARILTFRDRKYRILTFCDKKFRILTFCDKTELYLTVLQQNNVEACLRCCSPALSGSLLLALALSGSLLLSEFAYNILARLTRPLLSSQRRCCAATLYAALFYGLPILSKAKRQTHATKKYGCGYILPTSLAVLLLAPTGALYAIVCQYRSSRQGR